jgi:hypothetical protein
MFFGSVVLGPPAWEPGPKILGGPASAPKTAHSAPCRLSFRVATQHTTACCSMQVVDITLVKYNSQILHPSEWYNKNISVFIQALSITSHNVTKDSSSSSVQRGTLGGSKLILQTLVTTESSRLNMVLNSSRFILSVRCDQSSYPSILNAGLLLISFVGTIGDGVINAFDSSG